MDRSSETIFALASGPPPAAICVVRLSGPSTRKVAEILLTTGCPRPRQASLSKLETRNGSLIDEAVCVFMAGPASYTGEDTLEISIHGSRMVLDLLFVELQDLGCRPAAPGEFTRRAFENGKLDLTQAEAVADLIEAESEAQHKQALSQLDGALSKTYESWRQSLIEILSLLEATIDFPDEDDAPDTVTEPARKKLKKLIQSVEEALERGGIGERIRDGFRIALVGYPNAGKSTLLNRLAGRDAAIVTDIPGTTRDIVEVRLTIGPYLTWISDTAGLRQTEDPIELEGVRRAQVAAADADICLWILDDRGPPESLTTVGAKDLIVRNKSDLNTVGPKTVSRETLSVSALTGDGIDALLERIEMRLADLNAGQASPMLTRARHRDALGLARTAMVNALAGLEGNKGGELVAEDVRIAAYEMASLTGDVDVEEILGAVFSSFCIGK